MLFVPIFFLAVGYSLMYVIGRPVIHFATSSLNLFLLSDVPSFDTKEQTFEAINDQDVEKDKNNELASSKITYPRGGERYGEIIVDALKLNVPLYFGDTDEILRKGAGQYMGSVYIGEVGTTLVGGHNVDGFGKLSGIQTNDIVTANTTYANYQYQVKETVIRHKDDPEINQLISQRDKPLLLLYTCYPVDSLGMTDERLFVICELVEGPLINPNK
ncbi:hypothetical protein A5844_000553 [Enterococcus sp. 10A9_DIV0425]|uniref:Sortase n=1 Tax=Candidatus Enterococcus wittei TaxID=1987383 RepID=A0A2C9XQ71_9ENTE|nr:class D sortase [Enterococcus sp. 10A9_DIV0425]OTP12321.1 hypothetical protein A5844_000553 [Enterococcus sp. 10A9_DIV0425]THE11134.1 class D sortase [Enterococcus hirae]